MWEYLIADASHEPGWAAMSREEKNRQLFARQKAMLDLFAQKGAISRQQHDQSLAELARQMQTALRLNT